MRPGYPSTPPSQPSPYRQLGSGGQQPVRIQMIVGLIVGLVLVAVPLYLWRRPEQADATPVADTSEGGAAPDASGIPSAQGTFDDPPSSNVKLSPFRTIRCVDPGPGKTPPERCDHVNFFEDALARAIRENALCAPETKKGGTVSFVMETDFRRKRLKIYRGKSSTLSQSSTKELFQCVKRAMPTPDWGTIPHQHSKYVVNVKATFPPGQTF